MQLPVLAVKFNVIALEHFKSCKIPLETQTGGWRSVHRAFCQTASARTGSRYVANRC